MSEFDIENNFKSKQLNRVGRRITALVICLLMFSFSFTTISQEQPLPRLLLLYSDGSIQEFDLNTKQYGDRLPLSLSSIRFSPTANTWYGVHRESELVGFIQVGEAQIVEVDPTSGILETVYERNNIIGFSTSPNTNEMIITYFPDEIQTYADLRSYTPRSLCVLNIADQLCREILLPEDQFTIVWIGSDRFILRGLIEDNWFSIDFETLTPEPFSPEVPITSSVDLGLEDEVFVTRFGSGEVFGYLNIATGEYRPYEFAPELAFPRNTVSNMTFSPGRQYLLFQNGTVKYVLEMASGEIIAEIEEIGDSFQNLQWLSNNQIIARYFPTLGTFPQQIVIYDLETNSVQEVESFDETVFFIILPDRMESP